MWLRVVAGCIATATLYSTVEKLMRSGYAPFCARSAPLVGAGMDRVAHGWFVENIRPIEMAARARISLQTVGDPGVSPVDLLA